MKQTTDAIIRLRSLRKHYVMGDTQVAALKGIDLDITAGEFTALKGPSGSGKSTMLNICGLLDRANQGEVVLIGHKINGMSDKRRALVTIIISAVGVAGILISGGFAFYTYDSLKEMAARDNDHIILAHEHFFDQHEETPLEYSLSDFERYRKTLLRDDKVRAVLPNLAFSGLISNGEKSTVFVGKGISQGEFRVKGPFLKILQGDALSSRQKSGADPQVMIGEGLAKVLNAQPGDSLTLLANTVESSLNAIDVVVQGIFNSGVPEIDKRLMLMNIQQAQALLQTDKVSTLSVYLYDTRDTSTMAEQLRTQFPQLNLQSWRDTAFYYEAVRGLYNRIFGLLGIVILLMVLFAVTNTLSMAVVERTREIGALRAMGTQPHEIVRNFVLEALVMGSAGVLLGMLLAASVSLFFYMADFQMPPPPARSQSYPLVVYIHLPLYVLTSAGVLLLSVLAAWFVARKAAKQPVVESLSHV